MQKNKQEINLKVNIHQNKQDPLKPTYGFIMDKYRNPRMEV